MIETNQFKGHEKVVYVQDRDTGLKAIIAIHDTALGPAAGGCRMWAYDNEMDALSDALRLSRGMSYKNAVAGLKLGGGKSVIIADPHKDKSEDLLRAFGRFVDSMGGQYISAEDVGISVEDMEIVARETRHVIGLQSGENASGDPSPFTAKGVFMGLRAAVKHKLGRDDLKGLTVAVQGVGHVGYHLCRDLHEAGAKLIVADVHQPSLDRVAGEFGARVVSVAEIMTVDCDVLAPCALGAVLNDATIPALKTTIVAGAANNQLARDDHGRMLHERGVLYAPDYVINAGGIINVSAEARGKYDIDWVTDKVARIYDTLSTIFERSDAEDRPTNVIADELAEEIIAAARNAKQHGRAA